MTLRSTTFSFSAQALRYTSQFNANILKYQKLISSGQRLHRPSDDPVAFRQVNSLTVRIQELKASEYAVLDSEVKLNAGVAQLTQVNQALVKAKTIAQQGVQALSQTERDALALEAEGLLESLKDMSQSRVAGEFLFSGTRTDVAPFQFGDPLLQGRTLQVDYRGGQDNSLVFVGEGIAIDTYYAGDGVFSDPQREDTVILGRTGARPGQGTDNMVGRATLQVRHTLTTFSSGSGILAGTDSAALDTVMGAMGTHTLEINDTSGNGSFGTISLNGGPPVDFTDADTNLKVSGPDGAVIYLDTTRIRNGFNGTVNVQGDGTLSIDGGATSVPIDFSSNQVVVDSLTGRVTNIDSREIRLTGDDHLEYPGTSDVFQAVFELVDDLRNARGLSNTEVAESLDRRIGELDRLSNHVLDVVGRQSASLSSLDQLTTRVQDLQLELETQLSNLQSTDIPETVLRMQNDQALLEYTYAVTAQITSRTILDFLR